MKVLVDTSVWSLALRRRSRVSHPAASRLLELIEHGRVALMGPVRQELLCGIRDATGFTTLCDHLKAFPDESIVAADYEQAAAFYNTCRAKGIQGSNTDFLICAVASRLGMPILTTDTDFQRFARVLPIALDRV